MSLIIAKVSYKKGQFFCQTNFYKMGPRGYKKILTCALRTYVKEVNAEIIF
jgi:hypothetical protein